MLEKVEYFVYTFIAINALFGLYTAYKLNFRIGVLTCIEFFCAGILQYFLYRKKQYKKEYTETVAKLHSYSITNFSSKSLTSLKSLATEAAIKEGSDKLKKESSKAYKDRVSSLINKYHNVEK